MHEAYLSLGSNLGRRKNNLRLAQRLLEECGVHIEKSSKIYETKAVSKIPQGDFMNQCPQKGYDMGKRIDKRKSLHVNYDILIR